MKNFYVSCSVKYTDPENGQNDVEFYSSTIQANSKKIAEKEAKDNALKIFNEECEPNVPIASFAKSYPLRISATFSGVIK